MIGFSQSAKNMRTSEIRELMALATRPDMISFAGGMPNNDLFPLKQVDELYLSLSPEIKKIGFQYGPTAGYPPLLEAVKTYLKRKGLPVESNGLIITTGSLQAINLVAKVIVDPGDVVITEYPCFIGGTSIFKSYLANIKSVPINDGGIDLALVEEILGSKSTKNKMLYITPYFHNPAGIIYSTERKAKVLELVKRTKMLLLEDDAYGELYFDEKDKEMTVPIKALSDDSEIICYTGSLSKIFGPGMRLGWLLAPRPVIEKCELAKQSMDACSPMFTQILANEFMRSEYFKPYLQELRLAYSQRCQLMLSSLRDYMPDEVTWTKPKGGFYIWVVLPGYIDSTAVLQKTIKNGAVFVIGKTFDPVGDRNSCLRLAFSHTPVDKIRSGVEIVAEGIKSFLKE